MVSIGIGLHEESFDDIKEKILNNANQVWIDVKYDESKILPPLIRDKSLIVRNYLIFLYISWKFFVDVKKNLLFALAEVSNQEKGWTLEIALDWSFRFCKMLWKLNVPKDHKQSVIFGSALNI